MDSTKSKNQELGLFPISTLAEILEVHQRTLRIYDKEGVLIPKRSPKQRRLYSMNDIEKGVLIKFLTNRLGVNLVGVKLIFELLQQLNIKPEEYLLFSQKMAEKLNITIEDQENNKLKHSKRGRKKDEVKTE